MDFKSEASFKWLYSQDITKVKDLARIVQASYLWGRENDYMKRLLVLKMEIHGTTILEIHPVQFLPLHLQALYIRELKSGYCHKKQTTRGIRTYMTPHMH